MSRLRLGAATLATLATVAVLLVGCASSSKNSLTDATDTTASVSGATTSGDSNSAVSSTKEITPTSGDAVPGLSGQCKEKLASYRGKVAQLGSQPNAYKDLVPLLKGLLSGAPADVQAAALPTLNAFGKMAALIDKYNGDMAKASKDPDFATIGAAMSTADSKAANKKIEDWLKSTCGG